jgi:hypothetical protein
MLLLGVHRCLPRHFSLVKMKSTIFLVELRSIALSKSWKSVYFPNYKNTGHLRNVPALFLRHHFLLFDWYLRGSSEKNWDLSQNEYHNRNQHQKPSRSICVLNSSTLFSLEKFTWGLSEFRQKMNPENADFIDQLYGLLCSINILHSYNLVSTLKGTFPLSLLFN